MQCELPSAGEVPTAWVDPGFAPVMFFLWAATPPVSDTLDPSLAADGPQCFAWTVVLM